MTPTIITVAVGLLGFLGIVTYLCLTEYWYLAPLFTVAVIIGVLIGSESIGRGKTRGGDSGKI